MIVLLGVSACAFLPARVRRAAPARVYMDYMNPTAGARSKGQILTASPEGAKQDFLEASPYWDQSAVPVNTWKNKSPYTAKIVSCKRIVGPEATGETHATAL